MDITGTSQTLISVTSEQSSSEPGSLKSPSFIGRKIVKDTHKIWEFTHNMLHLPLCQAGAIIGGAAHGKNMNIFCTDKQAKKGQNTHFLSAHVFKSLILKIQCTHRSS